MEAKPISSFHRFLYRSYYFGSRVTFFIKHRVTPLAWGVLCVLGVMSVMGVDIRRSSLYQIFAVALALVALALICLLYTSDAADE